MTRWTGADVTVVITTIPGRNELLERARASVEAQSVQPATTLVFVDEERRGAAWARNQAIAQATTEWVAFLDDDDEFLGNHLKKMLAGANFSGADLIYTYAEFVGRADPLAVWRKVGGFPEPYSFPAKVSGECEDYGLLLRLLDAGFTFYHVVGVRTWRYHVWGGNTGGRGT